MPVHNTIEYASVDALYLDPFNPRLGRRRGDDVLDQDEVLQLMKDWTLDELAVSYLENGGFWVQEALLVVEEDLYGENVLVVVEGNRRLAALKSLKATYEGNPPSRKWATLVEQNPPDGLFQRVPYLLADSRDDIAGFLGFRHVTGIKEWDPPEKAEFIARLIDEHGLSYREVMRKIGSKTPTVRRHYIAYRLAEQISDLIDEVTDDQVDGRFSVMYLSLRSRGVQAYLHINTDGEPDEVKKPVPPERTEQLRHYARWMFGDEARPPLFTDSRRVDDFGKVLLNEEAVDYLVRSSRPQFEVAYRMTGGDEEEVVSLLKDASSNLELALGRLHLYKGSEAVRKAGVRLGLGVRQMTESFPAIKAGIEEEEEAQSS